MLSPTQAWRPLDFLSVLFLASYPFGNPSVDSEIEDMNAVHERDFYAWTQEQAAPLRQGQLDCLDLEYLAEEIEALGRSERRELANRLEILLLFIIPLLAGLMARGVGYFG